MRRARSEPTSRARRKAGASPRWLWKRAAKGKLTTAQVIARYEEVTRLDPGVFWDWVELGRLYQDAGRLPDALRAAKAAAGVAANDRDRSVAFNELGDVQEAQGDLPAALTSYRASLAIAERLAKADPGNARGSATCRCRTTRSATCRWRRAICRRRSTSYRASLAIAERLAKADPGNAELAARPVGVARTGSATCRWRRAICRRR